MSAALSEPCPWGEYCPATCESCRGTGRVQYSAKPACPECFGTTFTVGVGLEDGNREDCRACSRERAEAETITRDALSQPT